MAAYFSFPFTSNRSDVDGPIKRTLDGVMLGIRAARPDDTPPWDDKAVQVVQAAKVEKDRPMRVVLYNLPDEGWPRR